MTESLDVVHILVAATSLLEQVFKGNGAEIFLF